jgi:catechol 2,3-dioxygenase-like lactoylglutathione lyase family enzyme
MTLAVRDPAESVAFCEKYLGCTEIEVPDATLCARGIKWVRVGKNQGDGELHFVGCGRDKSLALRGGIDLDGDGVVSKEEMGPITEATLQEWIDEADDDMRAWTVFCAGPASMASASTPSTRLRAGNTHCAWSVADLTPVVAALEIDSKPFFGPVRRHCRHRYAIDATRSFHAGAARRRRLPALRRAPVPPLPRDRLAHVPRHGRHAIGAGLGRRRVRPLCT